MTEKCEHFYPKGTCWKCNPEVLKAIHEKYEINMPKLQAMSKINDKILELYQDCRCFGYDLDWETIFEIAEELKNSD